MKKMLCVLFLAICIVFICDRGVFATEIEEQMASYDIESLEGYTDGVDNYYTESDSFFETVKDFATGKQVLSTEGILRAIIGGFFNEAKSCVSLIINIIAISLLFSMLTGMNSSFNKNTLGEIAFFVCYIILNWLLADSFGKASGLVVATLKSAAVFINAASPVLMTVLITSGAPAGAAAINPVILISTQLVCIISEKLLLPLLYSSAILYMVSEINETIRVSKFADFLKKTVKWCLCLIMTVFVAVLSVQGFCASTLDGAAAKTARFLVGSAVPIVGGILSDTIETVLGCSRVIKNATGAAGMIAILTIATSPALKILALSASFHLGAAILEPMADRRISSVVSSVASITSLMAAIIVVAALMFIISMGMVMSIGNTG
ncbi:MAG: stage III sporulation protein AE [Ruminococcaceae bacterium]|nr:stage III sporulation protein AE [Oscillospiraceae bacterium]